jgi:hypothetical protein
MEVTKSSVGCKHYCATVSASGRKDLEAGICSHVGLEFTFIRFNLLSISCSEVRLWRVLIDKNKLTVGASSVWICQQFESQNYDGSSAACRIDDRV